MKKNFPEYFKNFIMPAEAREELIHVFRACRTGKVDRLSFLPTYEENGYKCPFGMMINDPSVYSLSVYSKPKDVKRFVSMTSDFHVPYTIAHGYTNPEYGLVLPTKEVTKTKSSHIDWWLYVDATPYKDFTVIDDFNEYLEQYRKGDIH